jgi:hypothetical protein
MKSLRMHLNGDVLTFICALSGNDERGDVEVRVLQSRLDWPVRSCAWQSWEKVPAVQNVNGSLEEKLWVT